MSCLPILQTIINIVNPTLNPVILQVYILLFMNKGTDVVISSDPPLKKGACPIYNKKLNPRLKCKI